VIREAATINTGTSKEYRCTSVGNRCNIMAGCHVAHDCVIGDDVVLANNVLLGGHVRIEDFASLGGGAALHHFVTVGRRAFVGGLTRVIHDVPPWLLMEGHPGRLKAINVVGAHRHGLEEERISAIRHAFRRLYGPEGEGNRSGVLQQMLQEEGLTPEVQEMLAALERQASGRQGRYLEGFRLEDNTLDLEAIPSRYRPRFIP
jgi:UDP-N-acetylglucosamine acyltransferase